MRRRRNPDGGLWSKLRAAPIRLLPGPLATCFALLLGASWALASAGPAVAVNTYTVFPCSGHTPVGITTGITNPNRFEINSSCGNSTVADHFLELKGFATLSTGIGDFADWQLKAPANSEIKELAFDETFVGPWDVSVNPFTNLGWRVAGGNPGTDIELEELGNTAFHGRRTAHSRTYEFRPGEMHDRKVPDPLTEVTVGVECLQVPTCAATPVQTIAFTRNIKVVLTDPTPPRQPTLISPPSPDAPLHGTVAIPFEAKDEGSGIKVAALLHDFVRGTSAINIDDEERDPNGGNCQELAGGGFPATVPCKLTIRASFTLDTTNMTDGPHTITVVAADAAGNETDTSAFPILVHNAPTNTERPALGSSGVKVGENLSVSDGQWQGVPPTFAYQWLRCPQNVADKSEAGCTAIDGATKAQYTVAASDVDKRLLARVTATNPTAPLAPPVATLSTPSAVVPDQLSNKQAPSISGTPSVGSQLKLDTGKWEDLAAAKISFASQWLRCPASVTTAAQAAQCEPIQGATTPTYTPTKADAGKRLIAKVSASVSAPQALSASAASAPTAAVTDQSSSNGAPQTKIAKHPRKRTALRAAKLSTAKFTFTSDQPGSTFQCKLDKGPFKSCHSPFKHKVKRGRHSFQVRAVDAAGTADPTPAKFSWRVS